MKRAVRSASLPSRPYDRMTTAMEAQALEKKRKKMGFKNKQKNKGRSGPRRGSPQP